MEERNESVFMHIVRSWLRDSRILWFKQFSNAKYSTKRQILHFICYRCDRTLDNYSRFLFSPLFTNKRIKVRLGDNNAGNPLGGE